MPAERFNTAPDSIVLGKNSPETLDPQVSFFEAIGRPELKKLYTPESPFINISIEFGNDRESEDSVGLKTGGGLGILEGDTFEEMADKVPYVALTLGYSQQWHQQLDQNFYQKETIDNVRPTDSNFQQIGKTQVRTNGDMTGIEGYVKKKGKAKVVTAYEPGLGYLYSSGKDSEHRLYQTTVLGMAGYDLLKDQGYFPADRTEDEIEKGKLEGKSHLPDKFPPTIRLNEAASAGFALKMFDDLCYNGADPKEALKFVQDHTLFTNHTLVRAASPEYSPEQVYKYFGPNLRNQASFDVIEKLIQNDPGGKLSLGTLALELAGQANGVSQDHARLATKEFGVEFKGVTNGIHRRWIDSEFMDLYQESGIYEEFDRPADNAEDLIETMNSAKMYEIKQRKGRELREYLKQRKDQYGNASVIPEDRVVVGDARRAAEYKQRDILLDDPEMLKQTLVEGNFHLVISGNAHPDDWAMKERLKNALERIDTDPELRDRITYIQDYDEDLAKHLIPACGAWINTPRPGREACGTSIFKAIANQTLVVSIPDGGMKDREGGHYFQVHGENRDEQRLSLHEQLRTAGRLLRRQENPDLERQRVEEWGNAAKDQMKDYVRVISGERMVEDYLNVRHPQSELESVAAD